MGIGEKLSLALMALFFGALLLRLFAAPLKLALRVVLNTALGFAALGLINLTGGLTGLTLGLNLFNALTVGILGVPGLIFLVLLQWVFV